MVQVIRQPTVHTENPGQIITADLAQVIPRLTDPMESPGQSTVAADRDQAISLGLTVDPIDTLPRRLQVTPACWALSVGPVEVDWAAD